MAIPKRRVKAPGTYFVTSRTWESRKLFVTERPSRILIEMLIEYRDKGIYKLHAFVVMPDHIHVLLTPGENVALERAVQHVKGGSARKIGEGMLMRSPVWQRGFSDHRIRDGLDYWEHVRYFEQNPERRRLAEALADYPWSSAAGQYHLDVMPEILGVL
jgi:putative transposase